MKKFLLISSLSLVSFINSQAQFGQSDSLQFIPPNNPSALADPYADMFPTQDNFLDQSAPGNGNGNANGRGNGIESGNGSGIGNGNGIGQPLDPIDPGPDPGIPVDGGILFLLAAGAILGSVKIYQLKRAN